MINNHNEYSNVFIMYFVFWRFLGKQYFYDGEICSKPIDLCVIHIPSYVTVAFIDGVGAVSCDVSSPCRVMCWRHGVKVLKTTDG